MSTLPKLKTAEPDRMAGISSIDIKKPVPAKVLRRVIGHYGYNLDSFLMGQRVEGDAKSVWPLWKLSADGMKEKKVLALFRGSEGTTCVKAASKDGTVDKAHAEMFCKGAITYLDTIVKKQSVSKEFGLKEILLSLALALVGGVLTFFVIGPWISNWLFSGKSGHKGGGGLLTGAGAAGEAFQDGFVMGARSLASALGIDLDKLEKPADDKAPEKDDEAASEPTPAPAAENMVAVSSPLANVMKGAAVHSRLPSLISGTDTSRVADGSRAVTPAEKKPISWRDLGIITTGITVSALTLYLTRGKGGAVPRTARALCPVR